MTQNQSIDTYNNKKEATKNTDIGMDEKSDRNRIVDMKREKKAGQGIQEVMKKQMRWEKK